MSTRMPLLDFPRGTRLLLGVVAEHDSEQAADILGLMLACIMASPSAPLLPFSIGNDCLVAPPERGGVHVELFWVTL